MSGVQDPDVYALLAEVLAAANALKRGRRQPGMLPCVTITGESWERLQDAIAACAYGTHPATASIRLASLEFNSVATERPVAALEFQGKHYTDPGELARATALVEGPKTIVMHREPYTPPKLTELSPDDARAVALRKLVGTP